MCLPFAEVNRLQPVGAAAALFQGMIKPDGTTGWFNHGISQYLAKVEWSTPKTFAKASLLIPLYLCMSAMSPPYAISA
jgi:hypothetical protein